MFTAKEKYRSEVEYRRLYFNINEIMFQFVSQSKVRLRQTKVRYIL